MVGYASDSPRPQSARIDEVPPEGFFDLWNGDRVAQNRAYTHYLTLSDEPVDWAYEVWDDVVAYLADADNHRRSIAAQLLSNLSMSDPESRLLGNFEALMAVTRDERIVTARHALQSVWKVGLAGEPQLEALLTAMSARFAECHAEKKCALIRYDISVSLRKLFDATGDSRVKETALDLIATETDLTYQKKYASAWK